MAVCLDSRERALQSQVCDAGVNIFWFGHITFGESWQSVSFLVFFVCAFFVVCFVFVFVLIFDIFFFTKKCVKLKITEIKIESGLFQVQAINKQMIIIHTPGVTCSASNI